jgi:hypothetical protein
MTAIDDDEASDRPNKVGRIESGNSGPPLAEEGLKLMKAFQDIVSPSDRAKVIALARKLAGNKSA